jgi:hypothetical protein
MERMRKIPENLANANPTVCVQGKIAVTDIDYFVFFFISPIELTLMSHKSSSCHAGMNHSLQ